MTAAAGRAHAWRGACCGPALAALIDDRPHRATPVACVTSLLILPERDLLQPILDSNSAACASSSLIRHACRRPSPTSIKNP